MVDGYKDSEELIKNCEEKHQQTKQEKIYFQARIRLSNFDLHHKEVTELKIAKEEFKSLKGWRDSNERAEECTKLIELWEKRMKAEREKQTELKKMIALEEEYTKRRNKKIAIAGFSIALVVIVLIIIL